MPFRNRKGFQRGAGNSFHCNKMSAINCICPACNTKVPHKKGTPCFQTKCPDCGSSMLRQFDVSEMDDKAEL